AATTESCWPPSEKLSGVTLRMPMTSARRPSTSGGRLASEIVWVLCMAEPVWLCREIAPTHAKGEGEDQRRTNASTLPSPGLPLRGGGAVRWLTEFTTSSMRPSPYQGEVRRGYLGPCDTPHPTALPKP